LDWRKLCAGLVTSTSTATTASNLGDSSVTSQGTKRRKEKREKQNFENAPYRSSTFFLVPVLFFFSEVKWRRRSQWRRKIFAEKWM
jgi:hypothetical protein